MSALHDLVEAYVVRPAMAGERTDPAAFDRRGLQRELARMRKTREIAFWVCVALLLLLFIGGIVATVVYRNDPTRLDALSAATGGITLVGIVAALVRLWQQKVKVDIVIALVGGLSEEALKAALTSLLTRL
jgi:protein-S-isoprenylcysteine O-methyltransferase Ste14